MTMETQIQGAHLFFGLSVWTSGRGCQEIPSPRLTARTWKCMARILVCFRDGIFWGAMLVSWRVVLPSFSHSGPKWYNCVVASKGSDFLSQLVYVLSFVCFKFGYQSETMMILNIMILAARSRGFSREVLSTTPHAFDAFLFSETAHRSMIWYEWITSAFVSLPSFLAPVTSFCYIISILQMFGCNL